MRSSENVLIVEDEDEWSGAYERAVGTVGGNYVIKVAKDLAAAERLIEATKFAVAFVDVGLDINDDRNVDGLRVMEKIRATDDDTSIIVVTGRSGQDVLSITRDAIKKYNAFDTVGKSSVAPTDIRKLLEGGLQEYRNSATAKRKSIRAQEVLRDDEDAMSWDHRLMQVMKFKGDASDFYQFLNRLVGDYLPIVKDHAAEQMEFDAPAELAYGHYWSRAIAAAVVICFGPAERFDQAIRENSTSEGLFGKFKIGDPIRELAGHGAKGAIFSLTGALRRDFGEGLAR